MKDYCGDKLYDDIFEVVYALKKELEGVYKIDADEVTGNLIKKIQPGLELHRSNIKNIIDKLQSMSNFAIRQNNRREARLSEHYDTSKPEKYTYHGGFAVGHMVGKIAARNDLIDDIRELFKEIGHE